MLFFLLLIERTLQEYMLISSAFEAFRLTFLGWNILQWLCTREHVAPKGHFMVD